MGKVFRHGQQPVDTRMLKDHPDFAAQRGAIRGEVIPENSNRPALERHQRREQLEERRFAAAVRAEQADSSATGDRKADSIQGAAALQIELTSAASTAIVSDRPSRRRASRLCEQPMNEASSESIAKIE